MSSALAQKLGRLRREVAKEIRRLSASARPRRVLFDHLPKCGGSSLNLYLQSQYPARKVYAIDGHDPRASVERFKALPERTRHGYDLVRGHLAHELLDYVHPERLAVTVLREPVDRIVSHYYYAKRRPGHYLYARLRGAAVGLEEYATSELSVELRNWYTTHFAGMSAAEAERSPEEAVDRAVRVVLERYDVVGFLDDFADFARRLQVEAKFRRGYRDRRANVTADRPAVATVPASTIGRIEEMNRLDVAFYRRIREAFRPRYSVPEVGRTPKTTRGQPAKRQGDSPQNDKGTDFSLSPDEGNVVAPPLRTASDATPDTGCGGSGRSRRPCP